MNLSKKSNTLKLAIPIEDDEHIVFSGVAAGEGGCLVQVYKVRKDVAVTAFKSLGKSDRVIEIEFTQQSKVETNGSSPDSEGR